MSTNPRIPLFERLILESQAACNRSCWFCPRTYDRSGKYLDESGQAVANRMPTTKLIELLDQAQALGFRGRVTFFHYSEPLLDERCLMLANEASARGMRPYLHTNGDLLRRDDGLCEEVKRVFQPIVVGVYDYDTDDELKQARRYWGDRLAGADLEFSAIGRAGIQGADSMGIPRALVPTDARMAIPDLTYSDAPCHRPLTHLIIQHDGTMCNCCEDTLGAFELGNVYRNSLEEVWFSLRHVRVIEDLAAGQRTNYSLCRNCPQSPTGPPPDGVRIGIALRRYAITGGDQINLTGRG